MKHSMVLSALLSLTISPAAANAALLPDAPRGEAVVKHPVQGRPAEICVVPKHFEGASYSALDLADERELCAHNIGANVAICPRIESSNPGLDFFPSSTGVTIQQKPNTNCTVRDSAGKKVERAAKYKMSTSCSYSPSITAYYHMSRALGNVLNIPVAVLRTLDLKRYSAMAQKAVSLINPKAGEDMADTWREVVTAIEAGSNSRKADFIFTAAFNQTYGALQKNPNHEKFYQEFYAGGSDRTAAFRDRNPIYLALTNSAYSVGREPNAANLQAMIQLRDAANFILLDTVMSQQDRIGNIHYVLRYFYPDSENEVSNLRFVKEISEVPEAAKDKLITVKEMILKDNDCGVTKENRIKKAGILERVSHMDPKVYEKLQELDAKFSQDETKTWFKSELNFTDADFKVVANNLREAAKMLKTACVAGRLKLDLDLDLHFSGKTLPAKYECGN